MNSVAYRSCVASCEQIRSCRIAVASVAIVMAAGLSANLWASSIDYGDFAGTDVMFVSVSEDSPTDLIPLFGAPIATSNSLAFTPTAFSSVSGGDSGITSDITDSQLSVTIQSKSSDIGVQSILVNELGDYTLVGPGVARASVGAALFWTVVEVNGEALAGPLPQGQANVNFDVGSGVNGGNFALPSDEGTAVPWSGQRVIDVDAFLLDHGIEGSATRIAFTLNNSLATSADLSSSAFIKKKAAQQITISAVPQLLPEPSTGAMIMPVILLGLALGRRLPAQ